MAIPSTADRVPLHTDPEINRAIDREIEQSIAYYAAHPEEIGDRLRKLDREWDIERRLEANAATVSVASVVLGLVSSRKWFFLPGVVGGFLLQHAMQGWCPPLTVFRRMKTRTQAEINRERYALKVLRGDFSGMSEEVEKLEDSSQRARQILDAVR